MIALVIPSFRSRCSKQRTYLLDSEQNSFYTNISSVVGSKPCKASCFLQARVQTYPYAGLLIQDMLGVISLQLCFCSQSALATILGKFLEKTEWERVVPDLWSDGVPISISVKTNRMARRQILFSCQRLL